MDKDPNDVVIDIDLKKNLGNWGNQLKHFFKFGLLFIILLLFAITSIYRLETGTVGVITRFGDIRGVNEDAGIHFKLPFVDQVHKVDVQTVHKMEYGYRTAQSGSPAVSPEYQDENIEEQVIIEAQHNNASIILLNLIIRFQIKDPVDFLYEVDDIEGTMRLALEDVIRSTLPSFSIDEALENKELIDKAILPKYQAKLDKYNSGIKVVQVTTQNVSLLPAVEETRQKVEESNQYKKGRQEEAQKYANTILPKANAEATKLLESAKGYSAQIVANANADVAEFEALYSEYLNNPEIVKEKYYIEAMQHVLQNNQLVIDQTGGSNFLKFFDVNKAQGNIMNTQDATPKGGQ